MLAVYLCMAHCLYTLSKPSKEKSHIVFLLPKLFKRASTKVEKVIVRI